MTLTAEDAVSYGLALVGADVEITNWVAKDAEGNILYNQKDYYKDAGTAPAVTGVNTPGNFRGPFFHYGIMERRGCAVRRKVPRRGITG